MSYSTRTMRDEDWKLLKYFKPSEFKYPDKMGFEFMMWLEKVRAIAGVPFKITSSYRPSDYNEQVGGATHSAHMLTPCDAVDIAPRNSQDRFHIVRTAMNQSCVRIGVYENGSVHLDRAEDSHPFNVLWTKV